MAKKKPLPPRRKRMERPARLQNAKKWYAVDPICAMIELRLLGITIPEERWEQARKTQETKIVENRKRKERRQQEEADLLQSSSDDIFELIAGDTPGGVPFGYDPYH